MWLRCAQLRTCVCIYACLLAWTNHSLNECIVFHDDRCCEVCEGMWRATVRVQHLGPGAKMTKIEVRVALVCTSTDDGRPLNTCRPWYKFNIDSGLVSQARLSLACKTNGYSQGLTTAHTCMYTEQSSTCRLYRIVWGICEQAVNHGFLRMSESPTVNLGMKLQCRFSFRSQHTDQAYTSLAGVPVLMY